MQPDSAFHLHLKKSVTSSGKESRSRTIVENSDDVGGNKEGATNHLSDLVRAFDSQTCCPPVKVAAEAAIVLRVDYTGAAEVCQELFSDECGSGVTCDTN